jgi:Tfp pilus assembly protein PilO
MTGRDRLVMMAVAVLAIVGAAWIMVVSPERKKAKQAAAAVAAAQSKLSSAHAQLNTARAAQAKYASSYAAIVHVGKAVPTTQEVPTLIYELAHASQQKDVQFTSIATSTSGSHAGAAGAAAKSAGSASKSSGSSSTAASGVQALPFTFVFNGGYPGLERLLGRLTAFATRGPGGTLLVNGRLLTIQGVALAPSATLQNSSGQLSATVTATAYTLPPGQPQSGEAGAGSTPASSSGGTGGPSSPTAPAVVGAKP